MVAKVTVPAFAPPLPAFAVSASAPPAIRLPPVTPMSPPSTALVPAVTVSPAPADTVAPVKPISPPVLCTSSAAPVERSNGAAPPSAVTVTPVPPVSVTAPAALTLPRRCVSRPAVAVKSSVVVAETVAVSSSSAPAVVLTASAPPVERSTGVVPFTVMPVAAARVVSPAPETVPPLCEIAPLLAVRVSVVPAVRLAPVSPMLPEFAVTDSAALALVTLPVAASKAGLPGVPLGPVTTVMLVPVMLLRLRT